MTRTTSYEILGLSCLLVDCGCDSVGAKYRTFQNLQGAGGSASWWAPVSAGLLMDCGWEGLKPSIVSFLIFGVAGRNVPC